MKKNTQLLKNKFYGLGLFKILAVLLFSMFLSISMGYSQNYTYTGAVQVIMISAGNYEIEMWGADGGGASGGGTSNVCDSDAGYEAITVRPMLFQVVMKKRVNGRYC